MKKLFFYAILAATATMVLASCKKEPIEPVNQNPSDQQGNVVITPDDPNYVGGMPEPETICTTNENGDTTAMQLLYNSYVDVDGETVSYQLKLYWNAVDTSFDTLKLHPIVGGYVYSECSRRQEGNFTVIDSVLSLQLKLLSAGICIDCKCHYEVAIYNDENKRIVLPYNRPTTDYIVDPDLLSYSHVPLEYVGDSKYLLLTTYTHGMKFYISNREYMFPVTFSFREVGYL